MTEKSTLDLLIGDAAIERFLYGRPKRGATERLKAAGWPIFSDGTGRNSARPSALMAEVLKRERASRRRRKTDSEANRSTAAA
jgi:hypothetical protein